MPIIQTLVPRTSTNAYFKGIWCFNKNSGDFYGVMPIPMKGRGQMGDNLAFRACVKTWHVGVFWLSLVTLKVTDQFLLNYFCFSGPIYETLSQ